MISFEWLFGALFFVCIINLIGCIALWIELRAMKMSTHQVQYVDPYQGIKTGEDGEVDFEKVTDKLKEDFKKDPLGAIQ